MTALLVDLLPNDENTSGVDFQSLAVQRATTFDDDHLFFFDVEKLTTVNWHDRAVCVVKPDGGNIVFDISAAESAFGQFNDQKQVACRVLVQF